MKPKEAIQSANLHASTTHAQAKADAMEGKASHTPGPFSISGMAGDNHIMALWRGSKASVAVVVPHPGMTPGELEANKALLAAAPELLEALETVISEADGGWFHDHPTAAMARAAIRKAKGSL